ncbi:hypothetical protein LSH36_269g08044 [Paralvinella palmiformis]|uniref:Phosphomannomutase n=1 Tax=Paralvinella palmiformis TaxID=53620 RepID=A0AAD9N2L0_9ANNE|nr:hypothetical protein LSH36_269g08044 [Paralvinella palmiformis]
MAELDTSTICLFDVDGTLTAPRQRITDEMEEFLQKLTTKCRVALVGGSDLKKINEQMSASGEHVIQRYEFVFSENGLVAHKNGELIHKESIVQYFGEEKLQKFINFALKSMSEIELPCKRGTFVEFRSGLINVCPVGRSCSQAEREQFAAFDKEHHVREKLVEKFKKQFPDLGLQFIIGGQISIDVYPDGWDKRYSLKHLENEGIKTFYFFGDKTNPGGNDHEIFADPRTIGHTVTSPDDTRRQLEEIFFKN